MTDRAIDALRDPVGRIRDHVAELERASGRQVAGFLEALLIALPAVVLRFDPELRIRFVSRLMPGLTEETVVGAPALEFIPQEDQDRARETIETTLRTGEPGGYETMGPGPDGELRSYQVFVAPVREADGRTGGCFVAIDTSHVRSRERALAEIEQKLRIALAATGLGLWSWDLSTGEVLWDERMKQAMGRTEALALPEYVEQAVHPEDRELLRRLGQRAMASGRFEATPHRIVRPGGEVRWMITVGEMECDADGQPLRVMGGNIDVTEQRALEEQLLRARQMEVIGRLTAGVAHNFNNMLMSVVPSLELLRSVVPATHLSLLNDAVASAEHAADMVRKLMTFTGQRRPVSRSSCDLGALVERSVAMCARTFDRHIELQCRVSATRPHVNAAAVDLEQVLMNLLLNAQDALLEAKQAAPQIDVVVESAAADPRLPGVSPVLVLRVQDNGTGMSEHVRRHAFEPFFTSKDIGRGTGLGLATSYALVRDLGGHIDIDSVLGRGTTVSVLLPAAVAPEMEQEASRSQRRQAIGAKVLVVDDEPQILRLVAMVLTDCGCLVRSASSGPSALAELAREQADVILLDRSMPDTRASSLLTTLREAAPAAKIAYFTGQEVPPDDRARVDAVIQKPVRIAELEAAVTELVQNRSSQ